MTALDRLISNTDEVIGVLYDLSHPDPKDIVFNRIADDGTVEEITLSNIAKIKTEVEGLTEDIDAKVDTVNTTLDAKVDNVDLTLDEKIAANDDYIRTRSERADYCRRVENTLTMSDSVTFSADKYLKWSNRLISIGSGSDNGVYGSQGHLSVRVPATDTVIPGHGNANDITVTDDGILMNEWGALYYEFVDNQDNTSIDGNWHYVGYNDPTGIIPENWILVASFNDDMDAVTIAGQTVQMGRVIYAQSVSDPVLGTDLQNVGGVIKDSAGNVLLGKAIAQVRMVDVLTNGYENDWVDYDSNWAAKISKDSNGVVTIVGLLNSGSENTTIGYLPVEYRPIQVRTMFINQANTDKFERMDFYSDGKVYCDSAGTRGGDTSWVSINATFQARVEV